MCYKLENGSKPTTPKRSLESNATLIFYTYAYMYDFHACTSLDDSYTNPAAL